MCQGVEGGGWKLEMDRKYRKESGKWVGIDFGLSLRMTGSFIISE